MPAYTELFLKRRIQYRTAQHWLNVSADSMFYYNEYTCKGSVEDEDDARKSFPSGHASVVSFVAVFVAVYLQRRSSRAVSAVFLLRPIIQV